LLSVWLFGLQEADNIVHYEEDTIQQNFLKLNTNIKAAMGKHEILQPKASDLRHKKQNKLQNKKERKGTKGQTMTNKTLHSKQKIEQHEPLLNGGKVRSFGRVSSSCSTSRNCVRS
jgi:chromatin segregation and condensation protein Rec8/ScpA/Scc1 (kleisin family)